VVAADALSRIVLRVLTGYEETLRRWKGKADWLWPHGYPPLRHPGVALSSRSKKRLRHYLRCRHATHKVTSIRVDFESRPDRPSSDYRSWIGNQISDGTILLTTAIYCMNTSSLPLNTCLSLAFHRNLTLMQYHPARGANLASYECEEDQNLT